MQDTLTLGNRYSYRYVYLITSGKWPESAERFKKLSTHQQNGFAQQFVWD